MRFSSIEELLRARPRMAAPGGPVAALLCEDDVLAADSADALFARGFEDVLAIGPGAETLPQDNPKLRSSAANIREPAARARALTRLAHACAGRWMAIIFNGEFLFHPFADTRPVAALTDFLETERRRSASGCAIDLYDDGMIAGAAPDLSAACFDTEGWYGFEHENRLADVRGGLGWRFEDHAPPALARVNRPVLFIASATLEINDDLWLSDSELNTVSCPWHQSPTLAVMSYRRTRRILAQPGMRNLKTLLWPKSARFEWRAAQLAEIGMIDEGQWF